MIKYFSRLFLHHNLLYLSTSQTKTNNHKRNSLILLKLVKMSSSVPSKIFIQIDSSAEQQENIKTTRKSSRTLAVLQKTGATDKENLVGRQPAYIAKEQLIRKTIEK